jgi:hypothetical protein
MSSGHRHQGKLTDKELDALLDEVLADRRAQAELAKPYKVDVSYDIALLGSSAVGWRTIYIDRHFREKNGAFGVLTVGGRKLDTKPGLLRHERLEAVCENVFGWPYELSHFVAQHFEERDYKAKGFKPEDVEKAFKTYIKGDEGEPITKSPTDLDMRPLMAPPADTKIIARVHEAAQKERVSHESVAYVDKSTRANQQCGKCVMFISKKYSPDTSCTLVRNPIRPEGWCRRFRKGKLDAQ